MNANTIWKCAALALAVTTGGCDTSVGGSPDSAAAGSGSADMQQRMAKYTTVTLAADTASLTPNERQMLPLLLDAARAMDPIYWAQTWGSRDSLLARTTDPTIQRYIDINYGPFDRLDN